MAWRFKPFRRTGATGQPNIALMEEGEIAVNSYDQKIWMRVGSNLVEIANASTPSWGDVSGKPATATRWPTWSEVTGKPTIPSSSDYVATSGNQTGLSGNKTWTGIHNWSSTSATPNITTERTNNTVNSLFGATTTAGTVYFGHGMANSFSVGDSSSLHTASANWFRVNSSAAYVHNNLVYHAGNFSPESKADLNSSNTFNGTQTVSSGGTAEVVLSGSGDPGGIFSNSGNTTLYGGSSIRMRPNGRGSTTGEAIISSSGDLSVKGAITAVNNLTANVAFANSFRATAGAGDLCGSGTGTGIRLMPNGFSTTNMTDIDGSGNMAVRGNVSVTGQVVTNGSNRPFQIYNQGGLHGYIEWYVESSASTRSGYLGYGSGSSSTLTIANQKSGGDIMLSTSGAGEVSANGNIKTTGTVSDSVGNVRKMDFRSVNGTITLAGSDLNRVLEKTNNSSYTYTIPSGHGSQGDAITFVNSGTSGNITINRATGVSLYRNGTNANITVGPGSMITIYRSATNNRWIA